MFGFLEDIAKAALGVVTTPLTVVADVATLGGALTDREESYTSAQLAEIFQNLHNATKPN